MLLCSNLKFPKNIKIFARMNPLSKSLIINNLKNKYLMNLLQLKVAMIGDGANDLMAIK
jgi:P-type E1-E2 ATPase